LLSSCVASAFISPHPLSPLLRYCPRTSLAPHSTVDNISGHFPSLFFLYLFYEVSPYGRPSNTSLQKMLVKGLISLNELPPFSPLTTNARRPNFATFTPACPLIWLTSHFPALLEDADPFFQPTRPRHPSNSPGFSLPLPSLSSS